MSCKNVNQFSHRRIVESKMKKNKIKKAYNKVNYRWNITTRTSLAYCHCVGQQTSNHELFLFQGSVHVYTYMQCWNQTVRGCNRQTFRFWVRYHAVDKNYTRTRPRYRRLLGFLYWPVTLVFLILCFGWFSLLKQWFLFYLIINTVLIGELSWDCHIWTCSVHYCSPVYNLWCRLEAGFAAVER